MEALFFCYVGIVSVDILDGNPNQVHGECM